MRKDYKYVGKHLVRSDAHDIVTGRAEFIDDMSFPRLLYGRALLSPYAHAIIKKIDTSKAEAIVGVKAVLTYKNVPDWYTGLPQHRRIIDSKVRCIGDVVALVAATGEKIAEFALSQIFVEYEVLSANLSPSDSMNEGAILLYSQFPGNELEPGCPQFSKTPFDHLKTGNVDQGLTQSAFVAQGEFSYSHTPLPLPPEPPGVIAKWENTTDLMIWASSGSPYLFKMVLEDSIPEATVRLIGVRTGGSYGNKQMLVSLAFYAAALAQAAKSTVKFILNKYEQMMTWERRIGSYFSGKLGLNKDGFVNAVSGEWIVDTGFTSTIAQGQMAVGLGEANVMMAKCKNWDLKGKVVVTNHPPGGPVRGFGGLELKSVLLPLLFSAMKQGNFDPVDVYKMNFVKDGDQYIWRDGRIKTCYEADYAKAIDEAANKFNWREKWKGWNIPTCVNDTMSRGVGVAVHGNADISEDRTEAFCQLDGHGNVTISCCIGETGTGQRHAIKKMVAELLHVPFEKVQLTDADTMSNPFDFGLVGSRGTLAIGSACLDAARNAMDRLLQKASVILDIPKDYLTNEGAMILHKYKNGISIPWIAITNGPGLTITGCGEYEGCYNRPNFVIYFIEVMVDLMTGITTIDNIVIGTDVGQIIDPVNLKMQLEGSIGAACLDSALYEECIYDSLTGKMLNGNMIDYKWRPFSDLPKIETTILESQFDTHQYKAIGVGEISGAPAPAAMLMAVSNAIGSEIKEYPMRPEKILKAINKERLS